MRLPFPPAAIFAAGTLAIGCGAAQRCPELSPPPPRSASPVASTSAPVAPAKKNAAPPGSPRVTIILTPDPTTATVDVEVAAAAPTDPAALERWSLAADGGADVFHLKAIRDDRGPLESQLIAKPNEPLALTLKRPPVGEVHISYTLDSRPHPPPATPTVDADPNRFQASGEALLLLPDSLDDRVVTAQIRFKTEKYGTNEDLGEIVASPASSFGVGAVREAIVVGRELRLGAYLAGRMGHASFDTPEGHDEAAWFGYTTFDPRPISADVAAFRTAVRELFRDKSTAGSAPMTLLIVADNRSPGSFLASRRGQGVLVHVGVSEPWSGPVRIAVAAEVLHAWIGSRLWIGPTDPAHEAEAYWFTEGMNRHLARDLLFRFGLITTSELLDELHGLASVLATSPHLAWGNAELAAHRRKPGVVPLLVARGALYAARIDARLRKTSGDKRTLDDVLRTLFAKARDQRAALPTSAWVEVITRELGAGEAEVFAKTIEKGGAIEIPEGAFGPCFRGEKRRYEAFDLGFDEDATRASRTRAIEGLRPGGPAERAGLRSEDVLIEALVRKGRSDASVTLTIERGKDKEKKTLQYKPAGKAASGQGWVRKKDVPDEACVK
jgi:hypothetical protein